MSTATSVKEAIKIWETKEDERRKQEYEKAIAAAEAAGRDPATIEKPPPVDATQEHIIRLIGYLPPIMKLDKDLFVLKNVRHLGLSSNAIDKIPPGLNSLPHLEILTFSRNNIRKFENLDLPNLKELWASSCRIERLAGLQSLRSLHTLHIANNSVAAWSEVERNLATLPSLTEVSLKHNPIGRSDSYRVVCISRLPNLLKLDGLVRA